MSPTLRTGSVDATRALGEAIAALVWPGDVVLLAGELGAGKTAFVQGFARGLGVTEAVTSPTFVLARDYAGGRLPLHHLDVYRLDQLNEVLDIGLPELLDDGGVVVVEWGDAILPVLPPEYLEVRLSFGEGDDDREIVVRGVGSTWASRLAALGRAIEPWQASATGGGAC